MDQTSLRLAELAFRQSVAEERKRQDEKWGIDFAGRPVELWLMIGLEELHEALNESTGSTERWRELVQFAAVIESWAIHDGQAADEHEGEYHELFGEARINYCHSRLPKIIGDIGGRCKRILDQRFGK